MHSEMHSPHTLPETMPPQLRQITAEEKENGGIGAIPRKKGIHQRRHAVSKSAFRNQYSTVRIAAKALLASIFFVLYLIAYPRSWDGVQTFTSPRENVGYVLTERFTQGEGFRYPLRYFGDLPKDIALALTPRDAAEVGGVVVPQDFAGSLLLYALFLSIGKPFLLLAGPIFAILGALVLARIADELFNWKVGLAAFVLWLAYPPFVLNSSYIFSSDTIALFWVLLTLLLFIRYWREGRRAHFAWLMVTLGVAILTRYPNVLLVLPLATALVVGRRMSWRETFTGLLILAPFAGTLLLFNYAVYGDVMLTGYQLKTELASETIRFAHVSPLKFRPAIAIQHLKTYGLEIPLLLRPQLIGFVLGIYLATKDRALRGPILALLALTGMLALYYLPQDAFGTFSPTLNASVLRYLLPASALGTILLVAGLLRLSRRTPVLAWAIVVSIFISHGVTAWSGPQGIRDVRLSVDRLASLRQRVVTSTEPEALIATRTMDKVLFPLRQTITLTYLVDHDEHTEQGERHPYEFVPNAPRFADVAVSVYQAGIPMYLIPDFDREILQAYRGALRERGFKLRRVQDSRLRIYKIAAQKNRQLPLAVDTKLIRGNLSS